MSHDITKEILERELRPNEIGILNLLLSGEISAVETYNQAIQKVKDTHLIPSLEDCRNSHAIRVEKLRGRIQGLGELAAHDAGVWGILANFVEGAAAVFGDIAAVSVLAGGEEYGTRQYEDHVKLLDPETMTLVKNELLPYQKATQHITQRLSEIIHSRGAYGSRAH